MANYQSSDCCQRIVPSSAASEASRARSFGCHVPLWCYVPAHLLKALALAAAVVGIVYSDNYCLRNDCDDAAGALLPRPSHAIIIKTAAAVRVGILGPTTGAMGTAMLAVYEGFSLQLMHHNAVKGGVHGKPIEWQFAAAYHNISGVETLVAEQVVDEWMANESTRVDLLAIPPGPDLSHALFRAADKHGLVVLGPVSGERSDFLEYSMNRLLASSMQDIEVAALIRYMVLTRHLRRIGVLTTHGRSYGNDLLPYVSSVLAEFGLDITYNYQASTPGQSVSQMAMEGAARGVQAVIFLGTLEAGTIQAIAAVFSSLNRADDWMLATVHLSSPVFSAIFSALPAGAAGQNNLITTTYC